MLDEVDNHKEVTLLRIKTLIDERTKAILAEAEENPEEVEPQIIDHTVEVEETVTPEEEEIPEFDNLPSGQIENGEV